jgi:hypothetical protein
MQRQHGRANVHPLRSQRDPQAQEPESPGSAVVVEVRRYTLSLPVEGLMVPTGVVETALIPWPLVPATLIGPPLIRSPLVKLATVATVSTVILSAVTALVALAVLWPARLPTIPMVGGRRAQTDAQPESAKAQRTHDRGSRHSFLETHCAPSVLWGLARFACIGASLRMAMLQDASRCHTAARWCEVETPLALSRYPPGLLPKPVVGSITHHSPGVGVARTNPPGRQVV